MSLGALGTCDVGVRSDRGMALSMGLGSASCGVGFAFDKILARGMPVVRCARCPAMLFPSKYARPNPNTAATRTVK